MKDRRMISERLKSMEHRTYLWLYLTFDIIEQSPSAYGRRSDVEDLLSELPSQVSEAYEKILKRSKNQTQTEILLQIVLAATRPLTLDEANVALTLALRKQQPASNTELVSALWPRDNFTGVVKNLCGLFVNTYDSKLSFIHQTAREFLTSPKRQGIWKGRLNISKSHSTISRSCLDYLLLLPDVDYPLIINDPPTEEEQFPFLPYATVYWPLHYVSQEATVASNSRKDARILCNVAGFQAGIWAPIYLGQRYLKLEGWIDLALASYLGLKSVVEDILYMEKADINARGGNYGTALQAASAEGHQGVVGMLLDNGADVNARGEIYDTTLQAASMRGHQEIVQMLLDKGAISEPSS